MQTRHPKQYGPTEAIQTPGTAQIFEASDYGLTIDTRPINPIAGQAFAASSRGGVKINLGSDASADSWFVADAATGGVKINPALLS